MNFIEQFIGETIAIASRLDPEPIQKAIDILVDTRNRFGRLFILGVGGSAANASHAVNDFRKICHFEAYAATDNIAELTARINDDGWPSVFEAWLQGSFLKAQDTLLVLSVGGGDYEKNISPNLIRALKLAQNVGSRIIGIVGRDGGFTGKVADACILIPIANPEHVTPHSEAFQMVVLHLLITHPSIKREQTKWEAANAIIVRSKEN